MSAPTFRVANLDAVRWLESLPDESVDLCITDPAYESLEKHRAKGTTTRLKNSKASSNEWFEIFHNDRFPLLFRDLRRVLKPNAHLYIMCDADTMFAIKPMGEAAGFKFWKPIIWDKVSIGMGYHYRARCERILFFEKGKRKLNDLSIPDILKVKRIRGGYPTEKPVDLMRILVDQSSLPGELVIDPFCGSGSAGVAAIEGQRDFWGSDSCAEATEISAARMAEACGELDGSAPPQRLDLFAPAGGTIAKAIRYHADRAGK